MRKLIYLIILLLAPSAFAASGAGVMVRDSAIREAPSPKAGKVERLREDAAVTILERRGGWYHVRAISGNEGWVRMLSVRFKSRARDGVSGEIRTVSDFASGSDSVATGVRGLSQDEEGGPSGGEASLQPVHDQRVAPDEARQFARAAGLKTRKVGYVGGEE